MNTPLTETDDRLGTQLRQALDHSAGRGDGDTDALQARVIAQWQQRHPVTDSAWATAGHAASARGSAPQRRRLWWAASALVLAAVLITVAPWQPRPDPALEELMQLDVLSLMSMGAM